MNPNELVYIDEYGIPGFNFYWRRAEKFNLTENELTACGVTSDRVQVHQEIIEPLLAAIDEIKKQTGHGVIIKEGLRPKALYELI